MKYNYKHALFGSLVLSMVFFTTSCIKNENYRFEKKTFYQKDVKISGRFINDSIRDGVFTYYYPSGQISKIEFYENGNLEGVVTEYYENKKISGYALLGLKEGTYQVLWYANGDTNVFYSNKISKVYYENGKPELFSIDSKPYKKISFDSTGILKKYEGPLDFITTKDSLDLNNSYPNWKQQVKDWEINK
jgi:antitoxin component YwqK of YwqJK toxin-antitoxin module